MMNFKMTALGSKFKSLITFKHDVLTSASLKSTAFKIALSFPSLAANKSLTSLFELSLFVGNKSVIGRRTKTSRNP